jgi:hypothetical protein
VLCNIYFNRHCLIKKVIPKYAKIKIPYTSHATDITKKKTQIIRLKDEIIFLLWKKKLKNDLYRIRLKAAHEWGNTWYTILDSIHESVNQELERKYKTIEEKKLVHTQTIKPTTWETFILESSIKPT